MDNTVEKGRTPILLDAEQEIEGYHSLAADAFKAFDLLGKVARLEYLSSDVYTDVRELRERLLVRAGHAEGQVFGIENYVLPVQGAINKLIADLTGGDPELLSTDDHQFYLGVVQAASVVEQATGIRLWGFYNPED